MIDGEEQADAFAKASRDSYNVVRPRYAEDSTDSLFLDKLGGGKRYRGRGPRNRAAAMAQGYRMAEKHPEGPCGLQVVGNRRSRRRMRGKGKGN